MTRAARLGLERGWSAFEAAAPRLAVLSVGETWARLGDDSHVRGASATDGGAPLSCAGRGGWEDVFGDLAALAGRGKGRAGRVPPEPDLRGLDAAWAGLVAVVAQMTDARAARVEAMIAQEDAGEGRAGPAGGIGVSLVYGWGGADEWRAGVSIGRYGMGEGDASPVTALVETAFDLRAGGGDVLEWGGG